MAAERGPGVRFRAAGPDDAAALLALKRRLDRESSFMLLEPGERTEDSGDVAAHLGLVASAANSVVIVAVTLPARRETGGDCVTR